MANIIIDEEALLLEIKDAELISPTKDDYYKLLIKIIEGECLKSQIAYLREVNSHNQVR